MLRRVAITGMSVALVAQFVLPMSANADTRKVDVHRALAEIYERMGQAPQAMEQYAALGMLCPQDSDVQVRFGMLLARQKEFRLAVQHFRRAVDLAPTQENYKHLGDGLMWNKDYKGAEEAYERGGMDPLHKNILPAQLLKNEGRSRE